MNLAVSNIAWAYEDRLTAYGLLADGGFSGLEVAPGLLFAGEDDSFRPSDAAVLAAQAELADFGLTLVSMQSLLFGVAGAAMFGTIDEREAFMTGMERAIDFAAQMGIPNMVFGSPKQRVIPSDMGRDKAEDIAHAAFMQLADKAQAAGTVLSLEFNPAAYGTNFLTDFSSVNAYLDQHSHPALKMCFDVGGIYMNGEIDQASDFVAKAANKIGHVHISAPELAPAPSNVGEAAAILKALQEIEYDRYISIEMVSGKLDFPDGLAKSIQDLNQAVRGAGV